MSGNDYQWTCLRCGALRPYQDQGSPSEVAPEVVICSPCAHEEWEAARNDRPQRQRDAWNDVYQPTEGMNEPPGQ